MNVGLRIDVDTFRGTRIGVPQLCRLLAEHGIAASFFFTVGPDNMGRHIWRLLRPTFLWKMLRTRAAGLYGWDILFKGTFWPGPQIGGKLGPIIRAAADAGHEIGLHAWDHHAWQAHIDTLDGPAIHQAIDKGLTALTEILDRPPDCSAVPGWKCTDRVLTEKSRFSFRYNSDCRGDSPFYPVADGRVISQPQIPVTLPTYDEAVGRDGVSDDNYNAYILSCIKPDALNVLTIHAEVEGIAHVKMFKEFLDEARSRKISFVPLGSLLAEYPAMPYGKIVQQPIAGREGWVACQVMDE